MIESPHLVLQCEAKLAGEAIAAFVEELGGVRAPTRAGRRYV